MKAPLIVVIVNAEHAVGCRKHLTESGVAVFAHTEPRQALEPILKRPPKVVALDLSFAATARRSGPGRSSQDRVTSGRCRRAPADRGWHEDAAAARATRTSPRSAVLQRWAEHGEKLAVTGICGCSIVSIPMAKMEIPGQCQLFDSRVVK
jgi:hypothetical protein